MFTPFNHPSYFNSLNEHVLKKNYCNKKKIFLPLKVLLSFGCIKTNILLYSVLFRGTRKWFNGVKTLNARTFPRKSHFKNKYQKLFPVFAGISNFEEVSMSENFLKILEAYFFLRRHWLNAGKLLEKCKVRKNGASRRF